MATNIFSPTVVSGSPKLSDPADQEVQGNGAYDYDATKSSSTDIDFYFAELLSAQDYYPFGMLMPSRTYTNPGSKEYRYGFNGKELDPRVGLLIGFQ